MLAVLQQHKWRNKDKRNDVVLWRSSETSFRTSWVPGGRKCLEQIQYDPTYLNPVTKFIDRSKTMTMMKYRVLIDDVILYNIKDINTINHWLHGRNIGSYVAPLFLLQTPLLGHLALDIGPWCSVSILLTKKWKDHERKCTGIKCTVGQKVFVWSPREVFKTIY